MSARRVVQTRSDQQSQVASGSRVGDVASGRSVDRNRRAVRSAELVEAVQRLDTTTDPATTQAILQWIRDEYEERQGGALLGLFSRCYLGAPYVDHRLDLNGLMIVEHYTRDQNPPGPFSAARPFARNDAYIFTEVYEDGTVIPVRADGRPIL